MIESINVIDFGAARRLPARPRLKSVVVAAPISGNRIALRRGTKPVHDLVIRDATSGLAAQVLELLDGSRDVQAIEAAVRATGQDGWKANVRRLIGDLDEAGVLEDAEQAAAGCLTEEQRKRYSRNLNCWSATIRDGRTPDEVQRQLARGHVLVVGVGGLGSAISHALAMAGCGKLTLADFDEVELQNLNRQCLYDSTDFGKPKVEVARQRIQRVNPEVVATAHHLKVVSLAQAEALIRDTKPDVVVGGADRPAVAIDRWLADASVRAGVPYVGGALNGATGRVWAKAPGRGCFTCDRLWSQRLSPDHYEFAVYREEHDLLPATSALAFGVQIIAGFIGYDILHHLLGLPLASVGRMVAIDFSTFQVTITDRPPHPDCERCR